MRSSEEKSEVTIACTAALHLANLGENTRRQKSAAAEGLCVFGAATWQQGVRLGTDGR